MPRVALSEKDIKALTDFLGSVSKDPLEFVRLAFPWGEPNTQLEDKAGPDEWQIELLNDIKEGLKTPDQVIREAVASGHGIGKSAMVAWIILWAISTHEDTKGVVTANTDTQLKTKTWAELAKWYYLFVARDLFTYSATSIYSNQEGHEKTWRIDAIPWNDSNPAAFAGLHNQGKRTLVIFDEASEISDIIWEVAEGAMTDADTEIIWCVFGNPTQSSGRFHACFHKNRSLWNRKQIDSQTVKISNKAELEGWRVQYGEDSDFFKIRVKGEFPSASDKQFISTALVDEARRRTLQEKQFRFAPVIIACDPAWTGGDETVIYLRQGLFTKKLFATTKNDNDIEIAGILARFEDEYKADAVFIDLGYGTGIKSAGDAWGRSWTLIAFGGKSNRQDCKNKRAEMWANMKDWLKEGGVIPEDDQTLADDLMGPETVPNTSGLIQLESKEAMKKRGVPSPNRADALALTFAQSVVSREQAITEAQFDNRQRVYDPFAGM